MPIVRRRDSRVGADRCFEYALPVFRESGAAVLETGLLLDSRQPHLQYVSAHFVQSPRLIRRKVRSRLFPNSGEPYDRTWLDTRNPDPNIVKAMIAP